MNLLFQSRILLQISADSFANHRVLSHQNFAFPAQSDTNFLHLLTSDIIDSDDETFRILFYKLLKKGKKDFMLRDLFKIKKKLTYDQFQEIIRFPRSFVLPRHLCA
jgi:hypothetical protein